MYICWPPAMNSVKIEPSSFSSRSPVLAEGTSNAKNTAVSCMQRDVVFQISVWRSCHTASCRRSSKATERFRCSI